MTKAAQSTGERFVKLPVGILSDPALAPADKILFAVLKDCLTRNRDDFPSIGRLASLTGLSRWTVQRGIARLESRGRIAVARQDNGKRHHYGVPAEEPVADCYRLQDATGSKAPQVQAETSGSLPQEPVADCHPALSPPS